MRTVSPFRAALVVVAALTTASSAPAGAMYLQPDLVQIPAERLIANLERELDAAAPGSADRVRLELALGRLEAAAWARRSELITVRSPLTVTIDKPEVLTGVVDPDAIRGELGRLGGRGGTVVQGLLQATPEDAAAGCDLAKVMARYDYVGDVVLELMLRAQEGEERGTLPAAKVVVVSQTVGEDAVAACLAERVRRLGMPPVDRATTARVRSGACPSGRSGATATRRCGPSTTTATGCSGGGSSAGWRSGRTPTATVSPAPGRSRRWRRAASSRCRPAPSPTRAGSSRAPRAWSSKTGAPARPGTG